MEVGNEDQVVLGLGSAVQRRNQYIITGNPAKSIAHHF